mmetsp:Transcript_15101/g.37811  ORF Transcript_15101/g.37811 Transcript_15101/m.37811 type:complete len:376 (-) Transcript_15101:43-1170(-)
MVRLPGVLCGCLRGRHSARLHPRERLPHARLRLRLVHDPLRDARLRRRRARRAPLPRLPRRKQLQARPLEAVHDAHSGAGGHPRVRQRSPQLCQHARQGRHEELQAHPHHGAGGCDHQARLLPAGVCGSCHALHRDRPLCAGRRKGLPKLQPDRHPPARHRRHWRCPHSKHAGEDPQPPQVQQGADARRVKPHGSRLGLRLHTGSGGALPRHRPHRHAPLRPPPPRSPERLPVPLRLLLPCSDPGVWRRRCRMRHVLPQGGHHRPLLRCLLQALHRPVRTHGGPGGGGDRAVRPREEVQGRLLAVHQRRAGAGGGPPAVEPHPLRDAPVRHRPVRDAPVAMTHLPQGQGQAFRAGREDSLRSAPVGMHLSTADPN